MFKKLFSLLFGMLFSLSACNGILFELLDGDFNYIIDTRKNTAKIKWIYISAHTKKEIVIPKYVKDCRGDEYLVEEIEENAIKQAIPRMESFMAREEFMKNEKNFAALRWLIIGKIPFVSISKSLDLEFSED